MEDRTNNLEKRKSGIELLRIFAAMGVVLLHYNDGLAFKYVESGVNHCILFFLESVCICAVDLFILISGFFLCTTEKRKAVKVVELLLQVVIFKAVFYICAVLLGKGSISVKSFIANIVPNNYFVVLYVALYIFSPYLNYIFKGLNSKKWNKFLITAMLLFSVYPILVDLSGEILNKEWFGLSTIGAWGNQQGFTIINFILLYFVGAYIRMNGIAIKRKTAIALLFLAIMLVFIWALFNENTARFGLRSAWCYHNPIVIGIAVLYFLIFYKMNFYSKWINELARASFTCFLLHGYIIRKTGVELAVGFSWLVMLLHILLVIVAMYLLSYFVYKIYDVCKSCSFRKIGILLDKIDLSI